MKYVLAFLWLCFLISVQGTIVLFVCLFDLIAIICCFIWKGKYYGDYFKAEDDLNYVLSILTRIAFGTYNDKGDWDMDGGQ